MARNPDAPLYNIDILHGDTRLHVFITDSQPKFVLVTPDGNVALDVVQAQTLLLVRNAMRATKRAIDSRISSAFFVHVKGFGSSL